MLYADLTPAMKLLLLLGAALLSARGQEYPAADSRVPGTLLHPASAGPVEKRVNWFGEPAFEGKAADFLLETNRDISDGLYFCCGGLSFFPNGSVDLQVTTSSSHLVSSHRISSHVWRCSNTTRRPSRSTSTRASL